jgi:lectin-like protein
MASIARTRSALARAPIMIALCCTTACLPTRDLDEYGARQELASDGSPENAGDGLPAPGTGAGSGAAPSTSGGEPVLTAPPLDATGTGADGAGDALGSEVETEGGDAGAAALDAAPASACGAGELLGPNGHCYFFDARAATWDLARSACQERGPGWDLVSVRSAADSTFIGNALAFEAWIGANDNAREGTWVWAVDQQPFWQGTGTTGSAVAGAYSNWNATEPNGANTTNCARALPSSFGSPIPDAPWADLPCSMAIGAICEAYPVAL